MDVPSRNFVANSSAYWIQTQLAQPDIQQLVGGSGIWIQTYSLVDDPSDKQIPCHHTSALCASLWFWFCSDESGEAIRFWVDEFGGSFESAPLDDEHCPNWTLDRHKRFRIFCVDIISVRKKERKTKISHWLAICFRWFMAVCEMCECRSYGYYISERLPLSI